MTTAVLEVNDELKRCARFSAEVVGFEASSKAWAWLETRTIASGLSTEVDLVRRTAREGLMGPRRIVPVRVSSDLDAHQFRAHRHQDTSQSFVLHGTNEPLDDSNGTFVPERTEASTNALSIAPEEVVGAKLGAAIGDDVLGGNAGSG